MTKIIAHIPLVHKSTSTDINDNFLIQEENVFIMDNHRLALWCWLQEIDLNKKYNLIHIDAHPDMSETSLEDFNRTKNPIEKMSLDEYRNIKQEKFNIPLFRWDNYLKIFTEKYPENFLKETSISFTHHLGSSEKLTRDLESMALPRELENIFSQKIYINENKWIVNLDLDYLFSSQPQKILMYSEDFLKSIATSLKVGLESGMIEVLTIAFSPECCGSWENAEKAYDILNQTFKFKFIPKQ